MTDLVLVIKLINKFVFSPFVSCDTCVAIVIVLCSLYRAAVSAFSLVVLLVMLCEVAYMFGYLSK